MEASPSPSPSVSVRRTPRPPRSYQMSRVGWQDSPRLVGLPPRNKIPPPELFILGRNMAGAVDDLTFANLFPGPVYQRLRALGLSTPSALQKAVAPNLGEGSESIIVFKAGEEEQARLRRTLTFMIPILSSVMTNPFRTNRKKKEEKILSITPSVLIVTPSQACCYRLFSQMKSFLRDNTFQKEVNMEVLTAESFGNQKYLDVLITDIRSLDKSREQARKSVSYSKLKYLIFDDVQCYLAESRALVEDTLIAARNYDRHYNEEQQLRLLILSSRWSKELEGIYAGMMEGEKACPIIFIESHSEVLNLAKIKWVVDFVEDGGRKLALLKDVVEHRIQNHRKIVIACSTLETAKEIAKAVLEYAGKIEVISSISRFTECATPKATEFQKREIVIIVDYVNDQVVVNDCTYFFSYDGTTQTIDGQFLDVGSLGLPFMWGSLPKLKGVNAEGLVPFQGETLVSNYLLDGGNEKNVGEFYAYSKQLGNVTLSPEFEEVGEKALNAQIFEAPLCDGFKLFGSCKKPPGYICLERHDFNEGDLVTGCIEGHGEIEFTVVGCDSNLNKFKGKLLEQHVQRQGKLVHLVSFSEDRRKRSQCLKKHCSNKISDFRDIAINDIYGLKVNKTLTRAKVFAIDYQKISYPDMQATLVELIDEGDRMSVSVQELFQVPEEVKKWRNLAIDVILGNLCPPRGEREFVAGGGPCASSLLTKHKIFRGKVLLSLGDTVWVNPMVNKDDPTWKLRDQFLSKKLAVPNQTHMWTLYKSAQKLGKKYPYYGYLRDTFEKGTFGELYKTFHERNDPEAWAFLELDENGTIQPQEIKITNVIDPWLFHGILSKNEKILRNLEGDAGAWINKLIEEYGADACDDFHNSVGDGRCVLVEDTSCQRWRRGKTLKTHDDSNGNVSLDVLLVDQGNILREVGKDKLFPISRDLVNLLPFQAIALSLGHVKPVEGRRLFNQEEKKAFREIIFTGDMGSYVHATALRKNSTHESRTATNYYEAVVIFGGEELGTTLVNRSLAMEAKDVPELATVMQLMKGNLSISENLSDEDDDSGNFEDQFDVNIDVAEEKKKVNHLSMFLQSIERIQKLRPANAENGDAANVPSNNSDRAQIQNAMNVDGALSPNKSDLPELNNLLAAAATSPPGNKPNHNRLCPTVLWHQTKSDIVFLIQVVDLDPKDIKLSVGSDRRTINFTSAKYGFTVALYGKVLPTFDMFPSGRQLKAVFTKRNQNCDPWLRINFEEHEKLKWLKPDPDFIEESEDEDDDGAPMAAGVPSQHFMEPSNGSDDSDDSEDQLFRAADKFFTPEDVQHLHVEVERQLDKQFDAAKLAKILEDNKAKK